MIQNLMVPGRGLEFGDEISLSCDSERRVAAAAEAYHSLVHRYEGLRVYTVGGHPTLPLGMTEADFDPEWSEGELARRLLVEEYSVPESKVMAEGHSTSTMTNVTRLYKLRGFDRPKPDKQLGVVCGYNHFNRFYDAFRAVGCMKGSVVHIPVAGEPSEARREVAARIVSRAVSFGAHGDLAKLERRDGLVENVTDFAASSLEWLKAVVANRRGVLS